MEKYQNLIPSSSQNSRQFEEQVGLSIIPRQTTDEAKERELEVSSVNVLEDSTEGLSTKIDYFTELDYYLNNINSKNGRCFQSKLIGSHW